jgi:hypothetical protein
MTQYKPSACSVARLWSPWIAGVLVSLPAIATAQHEQRLMTLEGLVRKHDCVVVGRLVSLDQQARPPQGEFECDDVIKGGFAPRQRIRLAMERLQWRKIDDHATRLVLFFNAAPAEARQEFANGEIGREADDNPGGTIGKEADVLKQLRAAVTAEQALPCGGIRWIGMALGQPTPQPDGGVRLVCRIINFTNKPLTINADRVAPVDPERMHRALWVRIVEAAPPATAPAVDPPAPGPAPWRGQDKGVVFESDRPWRHKFVMDTERTGRPDRPMKGATVELKSGAGFDAKIALRRADAENWQVVINGVADGKKTFPLRPGAKYEMVVGYWDDYHYWTGNGAKIGAVNPFWSGTQSLGVPFTVAGEE